MSLLVRILLVVAVPMLLPLGVTAQGRAHGTPPNLGHSSAFARSFSAPRNSPALGSYTLGLRAPAAGYYGIAPGAYNHRGYGYGSGYGYGNGYGYGYRHRLPYAYVAAPYYWPFFDSYGSSDWNDSSYGSYPAGPPPEDISGDPAMMAEGALGQQIQRLSNEIDQLRYAQQSSRGSYPEQDTAQAPPQIPITLILRNGQRMIVQNYAVMGQFFWDFSAEPARKIAVSSIDVEASERATAASGGEFPQFARDSGH